MEDRNWDILNPWSTVFITQRNTTFTIFITRYKEIRHLLEIGSKNQEKIIFVFIIIGFFYSPDPDPDANLRRKQTPSIWPLEQADPKHKNQNPRKVSGVAHYWVGGWSALTYFFIPNSFLWFTFDLAQDFSNQLVSWAALIIIVYCEVRLPSWVTFSLHLSKI